MANGALELPGWVLHASARTYHWSGAGMASVKSFEGVASYELPEGRVLVDAQHYLFLNHDEPYTITIDAPNGLSVQSFCVFFRPGVLEEAAFAAAESPASLLDTPDGRASPLLLVNLPHPHDDGVSPALKAFRDGYRAHRADRLWVESAFYRLGSAVVATARRESAQRSRIRALRATTRHELYRRLSIARDYLWTRSGEPVTLRAAAKAAALSPNHLIRQYREAFGVTPYQDLRRRRIALAAARLGGPEGPHVSLTALALDLGFESLAGFFRPPLGPLWGSRRAPIGPVGLALRLMFAKRPRPDCDTVRPSGQKNCPARIEQRRGRGHDQCDSRSRPGGTPGPGYRPGGVVLPGGAGASVHLAQ